MTSLAYIGDGGLEAYDDEPGVLLDTSDFTTLLRMPTLQELRNLWIQCEAELRVAFHDLFATPNGVVRKTYGLLNRGPDSYSGREDDLWGLAPLVLDHPKGFQRISNQSAVAALVSEGLLTERTARGAERTRLRSGHGGLAKHVLDLPRSDQERFLRRLFEEQGSLDDVLILGQACLSDTRRFTNLVDKADDLEKLLEFVAEKAHLNLLERGVQGSKGKIQGCSAKGAGRWYAPIWFALYLARESVWLLPASTTSKISGAYPKWAGPIHARMSVPAKALPFAVQVQRDFVSEASNKRDDKIAFTQMLALAACSNVWGAEELRVGPMIGLKRWLQTAGANTQNHRSWAINRLYESRCHNLNLPLRTHPKAFHFFLGPKLARTTVPFNWVDRPHKQNLETYRRIFGGGPVQISDALRQWAADLRKLLPLFGVKAIENKMNCLNAWLLYIVSLGPDAPRNFREVRRSEHVNNPSNSDAKTFKAFLAEHFVGQQKRVAQVAMTDLRQAWEFAAGRDGFDDQYTNPFNPKYDSPIKEKARPDRTVRKALDSRVLDIIAQENLRDDMAFAKAFGGDRKICWRYVRDPETGARLRVFFPAAPLIVHIICHSGMRGSQGRWLDTGEGDALVPDLEALSYRKNETPAAIAGRNEGFLQLTELPGPKRQTVVGMWVNTGKTGPHGVPWISPELIQPVLDMIAFQKRWNPLQEPIRCEDPGYLDEARVRAEETSFPLFRDPGNKLALPITGAKVLDYWRALLVHCQPLVDAALGYHYPLILTNGTLNFDIHALRVTVVTTLLDNGVPVSVVQMLVGHATPIMTWYYYDLKDAKVHNALQAAIEKRRESLKDIHAISTADEQDLIDEIVTLRSEEEFVGGKQFRFQREQGGFIDVLGSGLCPGGNCETGGARLTEGRYGPVWRPRACSGCRYRVTGPSFLAGLVQRLNGLMFEIKTSMNKEAAINQQIEDAEDVGKPRPDLHSQVRLEQELRDKLFEEWCLELKTVRQCEAQLHRQGSVTSGSDLILLNNNGLEGAELGFHEVHEFALAQTLVNGSRIVDGSAIELPSNVEDYRDRILYRIAHANDLGKFFYSLEPKAEKKALDSFGELLLMHAPTKEAMQDLIDGSATIQNLPHFASELSEVIEDLGLAAPVGVLQ